MQRRVVNQPAGTAADAIRAIQSSSVLPGGDFRLLGGVRRCVGPKLLDQIPRDLLDDWRAVVILVKALITGTATATRFAATDGYDLC